jgi:asparagine synthase (glutamine-hydrolysing)
VLGLEHYSKRISFSDFLHVIKACTNIVEEPLATTSIIPMYFLSELAAPHVKVVLTGQGADEPLGGYARYKSELIRDSVPTMFQNLVGPLSRLANIKNERMLRGAKAIGIDNEIDRFLAIYEVFSLNEIQKLISVTEVKSRESIEYFYNLLNLKIKKQSSQRMMSLDTRLNLADDLLNYTDKITMHYSIECRVPMLDLKLIEFIESLPNHLKLNFRRGGKIIHKKFAKQILPEKIINRRKKGFESPTRFWFKSEAHRIEEMLLAPGTVFSKYFNQKFVAEIINQHKQGYNREKQIFLLISIYYIMESTVNDFNYS